MQLTHKGNGKCPIDGVIAADFEVSIFCKAATIDRGAKQILGAGTTEATRKHKQYAIQGPTTYLCT